MLKSLKVLILSISISFFVILALLHVLGFFMYFSDEKIIAYFEPYLYQVDIVHDELGGNSYRYVIATVDTQSVKPLIIFIHGAPGSWDAYKDYMTDSLLIEQYDLIAIDRLGYGGSYAGNAVLSIKDQSSIILDIMDKYPDRAFTLVGHSYGGPISAYVAANSNSIEKIVMLSPVNDPESEPIFWYAKLLNLKVVKSLMPAFIQVATEEKISHPQQLKDVHDIWGKLRVPVHHLHCINDWIAPGPENIAFSKTQIDSTILTIHDRGDKSHFIPFNDFEYVRDLILED